MKELMYMLVSMMAWQSAIITGCSMAVMVVAAVANFPIATMQSSVLSTIGVLTTFLLFSYKNRMENE